MTHIEYPYIDDEEREIIESLNRGEWSPVSDEEHVRIVAMLQEAARNTLGLPPEEPPEIPPRRRPLSLTELLAELPEDRQEATQYLDDEEREIIEAYWRGESVSASENRLCEIVAHMLVAVEQTALAKAASAKINTSPPSTKPDQGR